MNNMPSIQSSNSNLSEIFSKYFAEDYENWNHVRSEIQKASKQIHLQNPKVHEKINEYLYSEITKLESTINNNENILSSEENARSYDSGTLLFERANNIARTYIDFAELMNLSCEQTIVFFRRNNKNTLKHNSIQNQNNALKRNILKKIDGLLALYYYDEIASDSQLSFSFIHMSSSFIESFYESIIEDRQFQYYNYLMRNSDPEVARKIKLLIVKLNAVEDCSPYNPSAQSSATEEVVSPALQHQKWIENFYSDLPQSARIEVIL